MTDPEGKVMDLASITSSLKIDEAILRSRKVMEESKALTLKNSQKKTALEERLKSVPLIQTDPSPRIKKLSDPSYILTDIAETPKVTSTNYQIEDLQTEVHYLNSKISTQSTNIRILEMNLNETKIENQKLSEEIREIKARHRQEVQYLTEMYEEKLRNSHVPQKEFSLIDYRLQELEDKFKKQVECNFGLIEKLAELNKQQEKQLQTIKHLDVHGPELDRFENNHIKEAIVRLSGSKKQHKSKKILEADEAKKKKKIGKRDEENANKKRNKKSSI